MYDPQSAGVWAAEYPRRSFARSLLRQLVAAGRLGVKTQHGVYKYPREAKK